MSSDDMTIAVRDSLADLHMTTPVADVLRRGERLRTHRRRTGSGAIAGLATVAVVAGIVLAHGPGHAVPKDGTVDLAAFTVTRRSADSVSVTIRQMTDLSGLQAALRADGIPALVTGSINVPQGCAEWNGGSHSTAQALTMANPSGLPDTNGIEFSIHPAAVPNGAVLFLGLLQTGAPAGSPGPAGPMSVGFLTCASS